MNPNPHILSLADCRDVARVGGKAINLGLMAGEGLPVPGGFVVTTAAYRYARAQGGGIPADLADAISAAYRLLSSPPVAVRSSATAEDMANASMAGQYETILDVRGEAALFAAIRQCWGSLDSPRVRSYLAEHQVSFDDVAMGVVVQKLVPADVAGVLFTENPGLGTCGEMLIEASWGLGESVVSGLVQPDTLILDRATGAIKQATISDKQVWIKPGTPGAQQVPENLRRCPCLNSQNVHALWHLARRVADYFGKPQDIEWAMHEGEIFLLQARAITTLEDAETYRRTLQSTRNDLLEAKQNGRGDWVLHNLCETLPQPTPLTWSVIRRFMSGDGGFGALYRMIGFEPSKRVCQEGFLDLIAGRIYADLSRAPQMFFDEFPFTYDLALLRANPDAAQGPPTVPSGTVLARIRSGRRLSKINARLQALAVDFDRTFDDKHVPEFTAWIDTEKQRDLRALTQTQWLDLWQAREHRILDEFGPLSLMPSLICSMALSTLRDFVAERFWDEEPDALVNLLAGAAAPDRTVQANAALLDLAEGRATREDWLKVNGHRAPAEFDLVTPRWHERPEALQAMADRLKGSVSARELHHRAATAAQERIAELSARLCPRDRAEFLRHLDQVHRYLPYRENGKFFLMRGYELLRDLALDAGRRLALDLPSDIFLLNLEELRDALNTGFAPLHLMEQRRNERTALARVSLPFVITADDVMRLGERPPLDRASAYPAFSISTGRGSGPARIVFKPEDAGDLGEGYILVCPSTDPNWTPLFIKASGVIMERGGTLSHGAVVAREMGIPAVVLEAATTRFKADEVLTVDGHQGAVVRGNAEPSASQAGAACDAVNTPIPLALRPPPRNEHERRGARLRNRALAFWSVYFIGVFLLPSLKLKALTFGLMDALLLPVVDAWGRPAVVALVAAALATFTMVAQRFLTDNRRLNLAKDRAATLRKNAQQLPPDAPGRKAMLALASSVQTRLVTASFLPLALILGPMVMVFLWFPARVDPASWNARPGATVHVTALVSGDFTGPVTLEASAPLTLDDTTSATQSLPPIRAALDSLYAEWSHPSPLPDDLPWELREAAATVRTAKLADLGEFLRKPIPPQPLAWTLRTPATEGGAFPFVVRAGDSSVLYARVVLGDRVAPEPQEDLGDGKGPVQFQRAAQDTDPIQGVKVVYSEQKREGDGVFWMPFQRFGWRKDFGWLLTYIAAYLPLMLVLKRLLRIP